MKTKDILRRLVPGKWRRKLKEYSAARNVTHLHGPKSIRLASDEAVVTCLVKNGEFYIEQFIGHYSRIGFRHIFFMDNGSTDRTIAIAKRHENVSVYRCTLQIEAHQGPLKKYMAQAFAEGGWCLDADIDEFFDYPFSDVLGLGEFLEYLNRNQYTAVITQLLDMFSEGPVPGSNSQEPEELRSAYQFYDLAEIAKTEYNSSKLVMKVAHGNKTASPNTALCWGGIRRVLYGTECLLTKHSLFRMGSGVELFPHVHFVNNASLADVSCLMLHYKLTSNALELAAQDIEGFPGNAQLYRHFIDVLTNKRAFSLKQSTSVKFHRAEDLLESGFIFASESYRAYVKSLAHARRVPQ